MEYILILSLLGNAIVIPWLICVDEERGLLREWLEAEEHLSRNLNNQLLALRDRLDEEAASQKNHFWW